MFPHLFLEFFILFFQGVDNAEFSANQTAGNRFFNIIAGMDGTEELFQTFLHITFIESAGGCGILHIGLCLFQCLVNSLPVIKSSGEVDDFRTDENICPVNRLFKLDTIQRSTTAECDIRLSTGKYSTSEVDYHPAESQALALMNCNCPSQPDRILSETT